MFKKTLISVSYVLLLLEVFFCIGLA